jgi:hypothetical protein
MKLKTLVLSVIVLAVLSALVFLARRPSAPPSQDARISQPLVAATLVEKAAKLRLTDQGKTVMLVRQPDGTWRDISYFDLPADFQKLSGFIGNLTDAKIQRLVTTNPERISRLEFKDTKIELLDAGDKELWSVIVGKSAEAGGKFVKFDDEKKAYEANLSAWIDSEAKSWANAELLNLKPEDIAKVEVTFPDAAPVTVSRAKKEDAWTATPTPANQQVKADKVSSVLSSLGSIRFSDTNELTDPNVAAAKEHLRTFKLTTFDGKTYAVALGRKPEEKKLKPPTATTDGKTGPASLGSLSDLAKKDEKADDKKAGEEKKDETKPLTPEYETIPAGPVFAFISSSDANAPINALTKKRAFQVNEYTFTGLPQKPDEMFEPAPAPAPKAEEKKAEDKKPETGKDEVKKSDDKK